MSVAGALEFSKKAGASTRRSSQVTRLSAQGSAVRQGTFAARRLPVLVESATPALVEALEHELAQGALRANFYVSSPVVDARSPFVRIAAVEPTDIEVAARVGTSDSARGAVFELVQALLARGASVRVCFLERNER